jgi:hypothetical protein
MEHATTEVLHLVVVSVLLGCLPCLGAARHADTSRQGPACPAEGVDDALQGKPALAEATRVSTAEAARKAAEVKVQAHGSDVASQASGASDVLEFHAGSPGAEDPLVAANTKESKKSALKSVHGDAYGALDGRGAGKQTGGAVGATSKGGKASVYVETDRSHDATPAPH